MPLVYVVDKEFADRYMSIGEHNCANVDAQHFLALDSCDETTGWSVVGADTDGLTTATNHVWKERSLSFDKSGATVTTAGIQKSFEAVKMNVFIEEGGGFFMGSLFFTDITNIEYAWFRVGTDASNYNEWRVTVDSLVADQWNALRGSMRSPYASTGNGWNTGATTYMAIGVEFSLAANLLDDILVDGLFANSGLQTSADITSQITSSVSSPNVKVAGYLGSVPTGAGNVTAGAQRVTIATDDVNLAALKKALAPLAVTVDSYTTAPVDCAANTNDQELVAAPGASKQIWVYGLMGTVDTDGALMLNDDADTAMSGTMPVAEEGGFVQNPSGNFLMPWIKVTTNKALDMNTTTCTFDGVISYAIVSV